MKKYILDGVIIIGLIFSSFYDARLVQSPKKSRLISVGQISLRKARRDAGASTKQKTIGRLSNDAAQNDWVMTRGL